MDLALSAGLSTRHLSFLENGRARPTEECVLKICRALELPLRESNLMLAAAGYKNRYAASSLEEARLSGIKEALQMILSKQEPFPALVTNRTFAIVMYNNAFRKLIHFLTGHQLELQNLSVLLLVFQHLRDTIQNWDQIAAHLMALLYRDTLRSEDAGLRALYAQIAETGIGFPAWDTDDAEAPILNFQLSTPQGELKLFAAYMTFTSALDVTVDEIRVTSFFPADERSRQILEGL